MTMQIAFCTKKTTLEEFREMYRKGDAALFGQLVDSAVFEAMSKPRGYGCHNRLPITTVCKPTCQYTFTALGQADERCLGCKERAS